MTHQHTVRFLLATSLVAMMSLIALACGTSEAEQCQAGDPVCQDDTVVACVDGNIVETPCGADSYCNYGQCTDTSISFPDDAGSHVEQSEWWYYTGHLNSGDRHWGFEITIFRYDIESTYGIEGDGYMCHVAVTDKTEGEHYHIDSLAIGDVTFTKDPIVMEVENCRFEMDGFGYDHIIGTIPQGEEKDGKASPWKFDLRLEPEKRPVRHGGDGIIPMSDSGGTSWYYSYTRMAAQGTLNTPNGAFGVNGQAWMDHQWGVFDIIDFKGWDWWSMQFENGWEIMLFQFTDWDDNLAAQAGTLIDPEGNLTELEGIDDFSITKIRYWESPHTDGTYPLDWDISIPTMDWQLQVRTFIDDQEMYNPAQNYWEGDTTITGTKAGAAVTGKGYTELTGYATDFLDPK